MKKVLVIILLASVGQVFGQSEAIFELKPRQSMLMTGKGPGQDGAINPYSDTRSIAVVRNMGDYSFGVRIQKAGKIIEDVVLEPKTTREFVLEVKYELYLDSREGESTAKVSFKPIE